MNQRAQNQWKKARTPYRYLSSHIEEKPEGNRYKLTLYDLLLVSNFKGGSATIAEDPIRLEQKLEAYGIKLSEIGEQFNERELASLEGGDLERLIILAGDFCKLTKSEETKIDGFGPSFATALLNAYFPDLLPILDKRALNGASLISNQEDINSQGQVKSIENHYSALIRYFHEHMKERSKKLHDLDEELFTQELKGPFLKNKILQS